ncbi:MAG: DUF2284 domain-containing protein [Clostridia bacterium]|nr:DUF2284 domain-containing protein [Clostridia bacterium]
MLLPFNLTADVLFSVGVTSFGVISTASIEFSQDVRSYCEGNMCRSYGKTWACPPAVGTVDECREKVLAYRHALVFASVYPLEDSFDFEAMAEGHREFKRVCDRLAAHCSGDYLLLSNEGCVRCASCTYPDAPCRFPEKLFPSIEGFGVWVNRLAASAGISYNAGPNTVSYFGMLCYN